MEALDPASEWRRLTELYRQMSDGELLNLARQKSELTDVAQQCLGSEMSVRGLKLHPEKSETPPEPPRPLDPAYDEDRELVELCEVWSLPDALQLQILLDRAGIPFFIGPEKATGVDAVTSSFADGLSVQVMRIGLPWASQALTSYEPVNDPRPETPEEVDEIPIRCPKCHSEEVIFGRFTTDPPAGAGSVPPEFDWTCDSCGHHWSDDGILKEQ
jgi:hypothetical protein